MFNVYISDSVNNRIIISEEQKASASHSNMYKLLKQPVQHPNSANIDQQRSRPEDNSKNLSSLYILNITPSEALAVQRN